MLNAPYLLNCHSKSGGSDPVSVRLLGASLRLALRAALRASKSVPDRFVRPSVPTTVLGNALSAYQIKHLRGVEIFSASRYLMQSRPRAQATPVPLTACVYFPATFSTWPIFF